MSALPSRNGKKWSVNETLRLQREYELLKLDVIKIAILHERTEDSILFRLVKEGFADNFESIRGYIKTEKPEVVVACPKTEFSLYIDDLLSKKTLTLKEIQECVNEKIAQQDKKTTPVKSANTKRVLRKYLQK